MEEKENGERLALLRFRASFKNTSQGPLGSWEGSDCCKWKGVGCDPITRHVIKLDLRPPPITPIFLYNYHFLEAENVNPSLLELEHMNYLDLSGIHFHSSPIPEFLGSMRRLRYLNLSFSSFIGKIPHHLGNLSSLRALDLSYNWELYDDDMSWISKLSSLKHLALDGVSLEKAYNLFQVLFKLPSLSLADLSDCRIINIHIPRGIVNSTFLANVEVLNLRDNALHGSFPDAFQNMTSIKDLDLSWNSLSLIPHWLANLHSLVQLDLSRNDFNSSEVSMESILGNLCSLISLDLSDNYHELVPSLKFGHGNLSGCTRYVLEELLLRKSGVSDSWPTCLSTLDIGFNNLDVKILSDWIPPFKFLSFMGMSSCNLGTLFPQWLKNMTFLNRLSGTIPNCWRRMSIDILNLSSNKLSGTIPSSFGHSFGVAWLNLSNNSLHGELHEELKNIENLEILDLGENQFSGIIPSWIQTFQKLQVLRLSQNLFIGDIPPSLCQLPFLQVLDLGGNKLSGLIPLCICHLRGMTKISNNEIATPYPTNYFAPVAAAAPADPSASDEWRKEGTKQVLKGLELDYTKTLKYLVNFDLSHNNLVGSIPEGLPCLSGLIGLNLSHNNLSGRIPSKMEDMKSLESMDLSGNNLFGPIPPTMSTLTFLSHLNLSNNNFSGPIPKGPQFSSYDPSSFAGNPYLCGDPIGKACSPKGIIQPKSPINVEEEDNAERKEKVLFYFVVALGFITGFWGSIGVLMYKRNWRHACFRRVENLADILYVESVIRIARLKKMIKKNQ
ncbi:LRR receptor-like serine/threonine-protein kinase GSO2 [Senna tora]|uniref:LRR receptor-like serine/threonine-protein kinase GSO2 n=1 Tax=Senna tora TaxID=362788 RepID=A0A834T208_9FABA|nr:LRR receptor-like serine/threonine-protein kinase GSO2 [Senna tora]